MKTNCPFLFQFLAGFTWLFIGSNLGAAPLTWFPGPSLDTPISGAATTVFSGGNNLLVGGDSYYSPYSYPQSLAATNTYWSYLPQMYSVNIAAGAVANGGIIIVYGGSDGTNSLNTVIGYSPSGDTPQTLHPMKVARSYLGYAPDRSGNAYAFGGLDDSGLALSSSERYIPDSDIWADIASLPTTLYDFPAVFNRTNYIYIFGGLTNTTSGIETATVLRYSVSANSWTAMAPMPIAVAGSAATLGPDGKIYVVGGT
jgi:Galactose oxidase, central domain